MLRAEGYLGTSPLSTCRLEGLVGCDCLVLDARQPSQPSAMQRGVSDSVSLSQVGFQAPSPAAPTS